MPRTAWLVIGILLTAHLAACRSMYYGTMETLGYEKREILVDRVETARDKQESAKEQFTSALEQFKSVVAFDGGSLEAMYRELDKGYERSRSAAKGVSDKIDKVESVAGALFAEWADELEDYNSEELRAASAKQLDLTRSLYEQMIGAMRRAEATMSPVLDAMQDQVLFLKHNLNAQAIASIQETAKGIEQDIAALISEMQKSIDEANAFIDQMGGG